MKEIELTQGKIALIDNEDYEMVSIHKWHYLKRYHDRPGYASTKIDGKNVSMHKFIMGESDGKVIDHINGDTLDNRKLNLRFCTHQQNLWNRHKRKQTQSKYIGLSKGRNRKKWQVQILIDGKKKTIGQFESEEDAARAYDKVARKYYGEFAPVNFSDA